MRWFLIEVILDRLKSIDAENNQLKTSSSHLKHHTQLNEIDYYISIFNDQFILLMEPARGIAILEGEQCATRVEHGTWRGTNTSYPEESVFTDLVNIRVLETLRFWSL